MKYLVASDIHGSLYYTKELEKRILIEKPDKIILLGDLFYHGPRNSLTIEYDPIEVSKILNKYSEKIMCTKGNCDALVDEMICDFSMQDSIKLEINNVKFFFSHGHEFNEFNIVNDIDILVYGHEHTHYIKQKNNIFFINTGSVSLPRNDTFNSYLIIDDNLIIKDIEGNEIIKKNYKR